MAVTAGWFAWSVRERFLERLGEVPEPATVRRLAMEDLEAVMAERFIRPSHVEPPEGATLAAVLEPLMLPASVRSTPSRCQR